MTRYRLIPLSLIAILLFVGLATSIQPQASAQGENLLTNPGFEGQYASYFPVTDAQKEACPHGECTTAQMPAGWLPWWVPQTENDLPEINRMPEWKPVCPYQPCPFAERLHGGTQAMQYFTFHSTHTAGAWQRVTVPNNAIVKFSIWGQIWSSATDATYSDFPSPVTMKVGIDPLGGSNPFAGSVVWSGSAQPYDAYQLFEVEASAQGETVTVFMWSQPTEARKHNDVYWDDASLVVVGQGSGAPASSSGGSSGSAAPVVIQSGPTSTPDANGEVYSEVQAGDSIWGVAARAGITLDEILELNNLSRNAVVKAGDLLLVRRTESAQAAVAPTAESETATTTDDGTATTDDTGGEEAAVEGDGVDNADEAVAEEAAAEPTAVPEPTATAAPTGGTICLRAFDDTNKDGVLGAGEALRSGVAIAVANGESVVSNYITNGGEPFCIEGLATGAYRVTRSFTDGEVSTTAADWAISLVDGSNMSIDFGSTIDTSASAEVANVTEAESESASTDTNPEEVTPDGEEATGETNWVNWIVGIIVGVALLLLVGVGLVVFSARRMA